MTKAACVGRIHVQLKVPLKEDKSTLIACLGLHQSSQLLLSLRNLSCRVAPHSHSLFIRFSLYLNYSLDPRSNMFLSQLAVLCTLPFLAISMKKREVPSNFALYGYGQDFGGISLFYADGRWYVRAVFRRY